MSHHAPHSDDPKVQAYIDKITKRDRTVEHLFRRILHVIERIIAVVTIVALLAALGLEVYHMCTKAGYFTEVDHLLHSLLTIVVGLEFVRMLIDTT
ncbi:MAG: hypothetical protein E7431_09495, partial [Ruminococcaceae bacterium]|nr:hypothetical protein [Oscillospiraceae bacterium]